MGSLTFIETIQQNAGSAEQTASIADELAGQAVHLQQSIFFFKTEATEPAGLHRHIEQKLLVHVALSRSLRQTADTVPPLR